jgi:hypothetical protein
MSEVAVRTYEFTFTLFTIVTDDGLAAAVADALEKAGCDDGLIFGLGPAVYVAFEREAESLGKAIGSAVDDVGRAGFPVLQIDVHYPEREGGG